VEQMFPMEHSKSYEFAAAILGGEPAPKIAVEEPSNKPTIDPTRREVKMCEICTRTFTRPIGSDHRLCAVSRCASRGTRAVKPPRVGGGIRVLRFDSRTAISAGRTALNALFPSQKT
jgi:hypothetical protein